MDSSFSSIQMRMQKQERAEGFFRFRIGLQPQYISPKIRQNVASQPEILSQSQFNSSIAVPKFHNPSIGQSMLFSKKVERQKKQDPIDQASELHLKNQSSLSSKYIFINALVWLFYLIGSVETSNKKITEYHIIDCIGNFLSIIILVLNISSKKSITSLSEILHIWSIILTISFLAYPSKQSQDDTLISIISFARIIRLLFPLFINQSGYQIVTKFFTILKRAKKIISLIILLLFIMGLFGYQLYSDSIGNRCRSSDVLFTTEQQSIDNRLCGSRQCQKEFYCRNPKQINIQMSQKQKQMLGFGRGLYIFNSAWDSAISLFQMFTLNSWGEISKIYFDIFPGWISVPFFIFGFMIFQKLFVSLIVIFFDRNKLKRQQKHILLGNFPKKITITKLQSNKQDDHQVNIDKIQSVRSLNQQINKLDDVKAQKVSKLQKAFFYCIGISCSIVHIILASQFSLNPQNIDNDVYNRKIGIALSIFFILHFFILCLIGYEYLDSDAQQNQNSMTQSVNKAQNMYGMSQKEVVSTVFTLQTLIFFILLSDYVVRIFSGKYILEQPSGITSLSHFMLCLRLYYILLVCIDLFQITFIKDHTIIVIKAIKSVFKYLIIILVISSFFGIISHNISKSQFFQSLKQQTLIVEINKFLMFLINNSWQSLYKFSVSQGYLKIQSLFVSILGTLCAFFGSIIMMKYLISRIINESFWQSTKNKTQKSEAENKKSSKSIKSNKQNPKPIRTYKQFQAKKEDDDKTIAHKSQKSFFIFDYQNCVRQCALNIVNQEYYQETIRFRFYILYIIINSISCIAFQDRVYRIISIALEIFILVDILFEAIAFRFFGELSYTQNKIALVLNFISCFAIIILAATLASMQIVSFLQIMRIFIALNYNKDFKETLDFIRQASSTLIIHFLILIPISFGYTVMLLPSLSLKNQNSLFWQKLLEGLKISLVLICQKGWNLNLIFSQNNLSSSFTQLTLSFMLLTYILFTVSIFYSLAGILISKLIEKKNEEQDQIKKQLCNSFQLVEEHKIRQKILKIKPKFDYDSYGSGILFKICKNSIFQLIKKLCCVFSVICYLALNTSLSTNQRITVYTFHLQFFAAELLFFVVQSIAYDRNQQYYVRDFILNLIAIPGAYIGFVNPVHYSSQPYQLKIILLFFNALTVVRFIKIVNYFKFFQIVYLFIKQRALQTLNVFIFGLVSSMALSYFLFESLQKKQSIIQCFSYTFVGMVGGDFHSTVQDVIQRNSLTFNWSHHLLYFMVHLLNITFRNFFIAFAIYQLSDTAKQNIPLTNNQFNLYNFNQYFHENQFLEEWKKIDPTGKGITNYRNILHKSHLFIKYFSIAKSPYRSYYSRVSTFKKIKVPICQCQTPFQKEENSKPQIKKQYIVTLYDFLFALSKFVFKEMGSTKLVYKNQYFIRNLTFLDQPISIMNITAEQSKISNFSKKADKQHKARQMDQEWKKRGFLHVRQNIRQRIEQHSSIQGIQCVMRPTKMNSNQLYYAHRVKNRIYKYLKRIQGENEMKRHNQIKLYRSKRQVC